MTFVQNLFFNQSWVLVFLLLIVRPRVVAANKNLPVYIINTGFSVNLMLKLHCITSIITVLSIERWLLMERRSLMTYRGRNLIFAVILIVIVSILQLLIPCSFSIVLRRIYGPLITIVGLMLLFFYLITFFAYFKVYRIICKHRQQIQGINVLKSLDDWQ